MLKNVWKSRLKVDHMAKDKSWQKETGKLGRGTMVYVWTSFILHTSQTWVAHANLKTQPWWGRTHQERGLPPSWRREGGRNGTCPAGLWKKVNRFESKEGVIATPEQKLAHLGLLKWRADGWNATTWKQPSSSFLSRNPWFVIPEHSTCECCKKFSCQQRQHVHG